MSRIYDCWERLVEAVLRRQQYLHFCSLSETSSDAGSSSFRSLSSPVYDDDTHRRADPNSSARVVYRVIRQGQVAAPLPRFLAEVADEDIVERVSRWTESLENLDLSSLDTEFFMGYEEASRYKAQEVIGKGISGVVVSAFDTHTGEKVAIKRINYEHKSVSDATQILREIKLLRLLSHPDIVKIKHIMLPPSRREFHNIYVIFELMGSDLHQVIKLNDDLTPEHHQWFMYQLLRCLKYIHSANVFHRDLKPKNILANADCRLKICDFGLARASFTEPPTSIFWTDYVAMRWYRAPELCGSFFSNYTPAIDIWSIGCIFAEMLTGKPLFPGKNVVHQLDIMTDLLGTPPPEFIAKVKNDKARRYLSFMRKKQPVAFVQKFPNADPFALRLLARLLAFDPKERPTAEEALAEPYFGNLANADREPSAQPISKLEFEFEGRELANDDVRELIYREILEYHPQMLQNYLHGGDNISSSMYPSQMGGATFVDGVRRWFQRGPSSVTHTSLASSNISSIHNNSSTEQQNLDAVFSRHKQQEEEEDRFMIIEDFDFSGLDLIKVPKRIDFRVTVSSMDPHKKSALETEFFTEYGESSRYQVQEVVGKGSYGVVGSAVDTHTGEKVAIKKINDVFEHVSDATRILREIKLLRLLRHPDIVEIKHIMLPPSRREFQDIYVIFELMESDLHQVIKANDDLTPEHHQFFLYQLMRGLKYIHTANVFHRDLKPKNILANADCKLKICDFGLARVSFNEAPSAIFWTDYVATRWYRAPELCGSFFSKYTPAIDMWGIGCIFAEMLTGKPLFPGKNVVHQLDLMTDLLGTPPPESIAKIRNEKARRYLANMRKKQPVSFVQKFPNADPLALRLLERLLAFDPKERPTAEEALSDPYFEKLANVEREPSAQPISKLEFEFERRKLGKDDVRELIYREILEYHPQMHEEYLRGGDHTSSFMYPSGVDRFKRQFAHLEEHHAKGERTTPILRHHASLPRERVPAPKDQAVKDSETQKQTLVAVEESDNITGNAENGPNSSTRSLLKSASISGSKCIGVQQKRDSEEEAILEQNEEFDGLSEKVAALNA